MNISYFNDYYLIYNLSIDQNIYKINPENQIETSKILTWCSTIWTYNNQLVCLVETTTTERKCNTMSDYGFFGIFSSSYDSCYDSTNTIYTLYNFKWVKLAEWYPWNLPNLSPLEYNKDSFVWFKNNNIELDYLWDVFPFVQTWLYLTTELSWYSIKKDLIWDSIIDNWTQLPWQFTNIIWLTKLDNWEIYYLINSQNKQCFYNINNIKDEKCGSIFINYSPKTGYSLEKDTSWSLNLFKNNNKVILYSNTGDILNINISWFNILNISGKEYKTLLDNTWGWYLFDINNKLISKYSNVEHWYIINNPKLDFNKIAWYLNYAPVETNVKTWSLNQLNIDNKTNNINKSNTYQINYLYLVIPLFVLLWLLVFVFRNKELNFSVMLKWISFPKTRETFEDEFDIKSIQKETSKKEEHKRKTKDDFFD